MNIELELDYILETRSHKGWSEDGEAPASKKSVDRTRDIIDTIKGIIIESGYQWQVPQFITTDPVTGFVDIQWFSKHKKVFTKGIEELWITIGEKPENDEYLKMWGSNMDTEMEEGILDESKIIPLWQWLNGIYKNE